MTTSEAVGPAVVTVAQVIAGNVRAELARHRITQTDLARFLGWDLQKVQRRVARGEAAVVLDVNELAAIASAIGIPAADLLAGVEHPDGLRVPDDIDTGE